MPTYPIVQPADGARIDPQWGIDITQAVNDHQTRLTTVETTFVPQVAWTTAGSVVSTTGSTEVAMASWAGASANFLFKAGWVHEMSIQGAGSDRTVASGACRTILRVRKGVGVTTGVQLALIYISTLMNQLICSTGATRYVKNATAADITTTLGVSGHQITPATGSVIYGDVDIPLMVTVRPLGTITAYPGFASVAASIT